MIHFKQNFIEIENIEPFICHFNLLKKDTFITLIILIYFSDLILELI